MIIFLEFPLLNQFEKICLNVSIMILNYMLVYTFLDVGIHIFCFLSEKYKLVNMMRRQFTYYCSSLSSLLYYTNISVYLIITFIKSESLSSPENQIGVNKGDKFISDATPQNI